MAPGYRNNNARRAPSRINENTPAVRRVMYGLRDDIKRFQPGDRFLSIQEVKAAYAVSDSVAKVALSVLVKALLLDSRPGRGYFVTDQPDRKDPA